MRAVDVASQWNLERGGWCLWAIALIVGVGSPCVGQEEAPVHRATEVRVMSFNVRYGTADDGENHWRHRQAIVAETIREFQPDLLGTQETLAFQRDFLAAQLPGYEVIGVGRDDGGERGEMMALFYRRDRFDRMDQGHYWLSENPDVAGSKSWDSSLPRMVTWVKLRDTTAREAAPILFANTHFDHRGSQARLESARLIRGWLKDHGAGCRLILTGDFNAGEDSEPYRALYAADDQRQILLVDAYRRAHPQRGDNEGTFNQFRSGAVRGPRIDWIAVSPDWEVVSAGIDRTVQGDRVPSDHFPVTALLR